MIVRAGQFGVGARGDDAEHAAGRGGILLAPLSPAERGQLTRLLRRVLEQHSAM